MKKIIKTSLLSVLLLLGACGKTETSTSDDNSAKITVSDQTSDHVDSTSSGDDSDPSTTEDVKPVTSELLKNARAGISYYYEATVNSYVYETGKLNATKNYYSRVDLSDSKFTIGRESSFKGKTILSRSYSCYKGKAIYDGKTYDNAAIANLATADGEVEAYLVTTDFDAAYSNPFDLLGDGDFYFDYTNKTATIYDKYTIKAFLNMLCMDYSIANYTINKPLVFHYDGSKNVFTSCETEGLTISGSFSSDAYEFSFKSEFLPSYDDSTFYAPTSFAESTSSKALATAALATSKKLEANNDYTLTVTSSNETLRKSYHAYLEDDEVLYVDYPFSYSADTSIGSVNELFVNVGPRVDYIIKPVNSAIDPILTTRSFDTEYFENGLCSLDSKLFVEDKTEGGVTYYSPVNGNIFNNAGLYAHLANAFTLSSSDTSLYDMYLSDAESYLTGLSYKVKNNELVGYELELAIGSETVVLDYDYSDLGTTSVDASVSLLAKKNTLVDKGYNEEVSSNMKFSYKEPKQFLGQNFTLTCELFTDKNGITGKAKMTAAGLNLGYLALGYEEGDYPNDAGWYKCYLYMADTDSLTSGSLTYSKKYCGTYKSFFDAVSDLIDIPDQAELINSGYSFTANDSLTSLVAKKDDKVCYTYGFDSDRKLSSVVIPEFVSPLTSTKSEDAETTITFFGYGEVSDFELPTVTDSTTETE